MDIYGSDISSACNREENSSDSLNSESENNIFDASLLYQNISENKFSDFVLNCDMQNQKELSKFEQLTMEQEYLYACLLSLTTHFAQVQFRLQQIVHSSSEERDKLLKELEEFSCKGISELNLFHNSTKYFKDVSKNNELVQTKQDMITKLKTQVEDLKYYAYELGYSSSSQENLMQKQKILIDELQRYLSLDVNNLEKIDCDGLRQQVHHAITQLTNPLNVKEHLIDQLKIQVIDLERYIHFLQGSDPKLFTSSYACSGKPNLIKTTSSNNYSKNWTKAHDAAHQAFLFLQLFSLSCSQSRNDIRTKSFFCNELKLFKERHWGDIRACLEIAIDHVLELSYSTEPPVDSDYTSDSDDDTLQNLITYTVRKEFTPALRDLLQHGLVQAEKSSSIIPFWLCFAEQHFQRKQAMHAWGLLLSYYDLKHGEEFNSLPYRRLSQSFNLDINGSAAVTKKQILLTTIGEIISSHGLYKRSADAHLKSFVCQALNRGLLVSWLKLIIRNRELIEKHYLPWSYVMNTGFKDAFESLDKLTSIKFSLSSDLAIRNLAGIKHLF